MVRPMPLHRGDLLSSIPLLIGLFASVSALLALCAKHAIGRLPRKYGDQSSDPKLATRSPVPTPKRLVTTISTKALPFINHEKPSEESEIEIKSKAEQGFGEACLWQKAILMGEKCQPPEFSGVIHYDYNGNRISELPPRSPRASPLTSFSFQSTRDAN